MYDKMFCIIDQRSKKNEKNFDYVQECGALATLIKVSVTA